MAESAAPNSTTSSTLSAWAGPYVTNMLGKAQAVSNQPYALYGGDMTAGPSALQSKAFQGIGGLTLPSNTTSYNPMQFSSGLPGTSASQPFGVGSTESYMNPYLEQVLQPQFLDRADDAVEADGSDVKAVDVGDLGDAGSVVGCEIGFTAAMSRHRLRRREQGRDHDAAGNDRVSHGFVIARSAVNTTWSNSP